ncbi:hypothetical protein I5L79_21635 [Hymenobacter sp. BT594]|uniref:Uncharacterized protein n=1 Tax=Hymenobacter guriensis TaxID=2793065 RepID=A0ABS0L7S8_9BACT|nr:hypothetical protein [Hymenobacter guriensis]
MGPCGGCRAMLSLPA